MDDEGDRYFVVVTDVHLPFSAVLDIVVKVLVAEIVIAIPFAIIGIVAVFFGMF